MISGGISSATYNISPTVVCQRVFAMRAALMASPSVGDTQQRRTWNTDLGDALRYARFDPDLRTAWQKTTRVPPNYGTDPLLHAHIIVHDTCAELALAGIQMNFEVYASHDAGMSAPTGQSTALEPRTKKEISFAERVHIRQPVLGNPDYHSYHVDCSGIGAAFAFTIRRLQKTDGTYWDGGQVVNGANVLYVANTSVSREQADIAFDPATRQLTITNHSASNHTQLLDTDPPSPVNAQQVFDVTGGQTTLTIQVGSVLIVLEHIPGDGGRDDH